MEQLSISSFLLNGHDYHLYVYEDVKNVPAGTLLMDANEILPASRVFQYKRSPSYAGFANFFRYKLLLERGGWWADTDTICLKPFDFPMSTFFSSEINYKGREVAASCVIKAAAGSNILAYAWEVCQTKNPARLVWGETGPRLMAKAVRSFRCSNTKKGRHVFCPVDYEEWRRVLEPGFEISLDYRDPCSSSLERNVARCRTGQGCAVSPELSLRTTQEKLLAGYRCNRSARLV